ncbi:unnamed protein product, partial [Polarella glacialis]
PCAVQLFAAQSMRIAILGSGISAASCAQLLSKKHAVTVFEDGRGPGGRMSTRRSGSYQWDHGAQYFSPKSEAFARVVDDWRARGLCERWEGTHCLWSAAGGLSPDPKAEKSKRFVGSPGMNAIAKGLLEGIETRFETRALARRSGNSWVLQHGKTGEPLGSFDFLICSDKCSAQHHRNDLEKELLRGYLEPAQAVRSAPSLALMVATQKTHLGFASLLLEDHPEFSWLARDDSKPSRLRSDGAECWVAHASPALAKRLIGSYKSSKGPRNFREAIVRDLLPPFEALLSTLNGGVASPKILLAEGHRWGAAIPTGSFPDFPGAAEGAGGGPFYLDTANAFAACGIFGPGGRGVD